MSKVSCILLVALLCALTTADLMGLDENVSTENLLEEEGFGITEETTEPKSHISKCYDEETKLAYKLDSIWYPDGKCEQRVCSRTRNSKIPTIKIMQCPPCLTCNSSDQMCHPFRSEKKFPKCCSQCLTKSAILKKKDTTKKYKLN